ncbi:MAG: hypothetical protein JJ992_23380, partial [Planctomycetes bacterium]|nr:hypothetical protein [Planctomycetota bacterium]
MKLLDLTLETPAENLALDEALLEQAESGQGPREVLRLWESPQPFVVLGRSSRVADEVDRRKCEQRALAILRRPSGGASVVAGPGCLMYAVVLSYELRPPLQMISEAHHHVMTILSSALTRLVPSVTYRGISDLAIGDRKFSAQTDDGPGPAGASLHYAQPGVTPNAEVQFGVFGVPRLGSCPG